MQPNNVLSNNDDLPESVRTLLRAQILLLLQFHQPTNILFFAHLGYTRSTTAKILREFISEDLARERNHLYRLTDNGIKIAELLKLDGIVAQWMDTTALSQIKRPKVKRFQ